MSEHNPFEAPTATGTIYDDDRRSRVDYGGIGRLQYFIYSFLANIGVLVLQVILEMMSPGASMLTLPVSIGVAAYIAYLRLQNLGYSGWWVVGMFVPILNILVGLRCLAAPEGYADHKTLDSTGKIIIGVFFGAIALLVLLAIVLGSMS